jgi:hypothetical protein
MLNRISPPALPSEPDTIDHFIDGSNYVRRQHQRELELLYSKNQTLTRIRQEFTDCRQFNFGAYLEHHRIPVDFGIDVLVQMVLHKRTTLPTLAGILRHHYDDAGHANPSQQTAHMLEQCVKARIVIWDEVASMFVVMFNITDEVQRDLDRYQYPLPMVVPPLRVMDNRDTGYFTHRSSIILRKNHHDEDVCLDHINRVNRIRFSINFDTAYMVSNSWRNLDRPKTGESKADFDKRVKAFEKYDASSKDVISKLLAHGNEFYLTHRYDKRGRVYCQGYHVNYQGAPWNKAVIELADKEFVD